MNASGAALALTETGAAAPVNVLVADDDPTSRVLVSAALEGHVRSVAEAENGLIAVQALEQQPFDLAILDLDMPVMDGFGVIERARLRPETRHLPIIVVTGRDDVVAIERAFALGATSFLCKPINWNIFRHQVGYVLQVARVERETRAAKEQAERLAAFRGRGLAALEQEIASTAGKIAALPEEGAKASFGEILETGLRLQAVLSRVKRTSDILTGREMLDQTIAKAAELAAAAVARAEAAFGPQARQRVELSGGEGLEVACDRAMAVEALSEILENALACSPPDAKVRFAMVAAPGGRVRFEIEDRGPGIPEHIIERGFDGLRAAPAAPGLRGGLGLGLATARMIVERHGGHFAIMSEAGRGTEAFLSFPSRPAPMLVNAA